MYRSQGGDHLARLEQFQEQGLIEDVLGLVKIGKEASVYCCRGGPALGVDLVAAKVYRERQYRFKNDAVYQQARDRELGLRGRALRAMQNKSSFGRQVQSGTWINHEFSVLKDLYNAGADVPKPYASEDEVILMEYFGDEDGAAQQLNKITLPQDEAGGLFQRLIDNIEIWLAMNRVHGDLSPHNILYWQHEVRVIDFPQATDPRFNPGSRDLLARDIANVCRHFEKYGVESDPVGIVIDLWRRFSLSIL